MQKMLIVGLVAIALAGCAATGPAYTSYVTMDQTQQSAMTPDKALVQLREGNDRFTGGRTIARDLPKQVKATGKAQFPLASVVSCIDSRASPELVFDQGIGDIFGARIAGNFVNPDILGSLEFASKVAGSKLIVVLGHTSCGAIKGACDDVKMGNLTTTLSNIKPAVSSVSYTGDRSSKNSPFVEMVAEANVRQTVNNILANSPVLKEMSDKGEIKVVGAMLNVETGEVTWYQ
jgi:carbonic anhydrase